MFKIVHLQTQKEHEILGPTKLGRGDVQIRFNDDRKISKEHCLLDIEDDQLFVKDLSSSNGTFVNSDKIAAFENVELKDGDHLKIGIQEFKVRYQEKGDDKYGGNVSASWLQEEIERPWFEFYLSSSSIRFFATALFFPVVYLASEYKELWPLDREVGTMIAMILFSTFLPVFVLVKPLQLLLTIFSARGRLATFSFYLLWTGVLLSLQSTLAEKSLRISGVANSIKEKKIGRKCIEENLSKECAELVLSCPACIANLPEQQRMSLGLILGLAHLPPPPTTLDPLVEAAPPIPPPPSVEEARVNISPDTEQKTDSEKTTQNLMPPIKPESSKKSYKQNKITKDDKSKKKLPTRLPAKSKSKSKK